MRKWIKFIIIVLLFITILSLGFWLKWLKKPIIVTDTYSGVEVASNAQNKPEMAISKYLDTLGKMESCGEGIIDENGLVSKGQFCFQKSTYLSLVKKYGIYPYAEDEELLSNWGDTQTQRWILEKMIEEDEAQLAKHFFTSVIVRKLGLPYD